jgi:hypothetical protein
MPFSMAEADPIARMRAAAQRAVEGDSVEAQRSWHYQALNQDLGLTPDAVEQRANAARRAERPGPLRWFVGLIMAAAILVTSTYIRQQWRAGAYHPFFKMSGSAPVRKHNGWMAGQKDGLNLPTAPSESSSDAADAPPNLIEPDPPKRTPAPQPDAPEEASSDEST